MFNQVLTQQTGRTKMHTEFDTMSPARQIYIQKRAQKKGLTVEAYITRNQPKARQYPFTMQEDAQFTIIKAITDAAKHQVAQMGKAYKTEYEQAGGKMTAETDNIYNNPTDPVRGVNGSLDTDRLCYTYLVTIGTHTVGMVQTGTTIDDDQKPIGTFINDVYIRPEYRGWGIATRIYQYCVDRLQSNAITISYDRVRGRCDYWSKWFNRWIIDPHFLLQKPNGQALMVLTSAEHQSDVQGEMTESSVDTNMNNYFKGLKKLQQKMARQMEPA
jgi:GNAT superfamily N-acetyltransferase